MTLDISVKMSFAEKRQFYRIPHDIERINVNQDKLEYGGVGYTGEARIVRDEFGLPILKPFPEVYRTYPDHHVVINCAWQRRWRGMNPTLSDDKWSTLLGNRFAFSNLSGFPGHYNCITGDDRDKPFPRFDIHRLTGGAIVTGYELDGQLYLETLRNTDPPPTLNEILYKDWLWFWATSVSPDGQPNLITRPGTDGNYYAVRIPILTAQQVTIPLSELHKLPAGTFPKNPLYIP